MYEYGNNISSGVGNENPRSWKRSQKTKIDTFTEVLTTINVILQKKVASETICNCPLNNLEHI